MNWVTATEEDQNLRDHYVVGRIIEIQYRPQQYVKGKFELGAPIVVKVLVGSINSHGGICNDCSLEHEMEGGEGKILRYCDDLKESLKSYGVEVLDEF